MPKKIYLIRHGETNLNKARQFQGWTDTELNNDGLSQAEKLALRLQDEPLDVVISSDLKRASQTAQAIGESINKTVVHTTLLREQNLGKIEGQTYDNLDGSNELWEGTFRSWKDEEQKNWKGHGGESVEEVMSRISKFMTQLAKDHKDKNVAIVTHAGVKNRILVWLKINQYGNHIHFGNTAVTVLVKVRAHYLIESLGDTSHLSR